MSYDHGVPSPTAAVPARVPGVVTTWLTACGQAADRTARDRVACLAGLDRVGGGREAELTRRWLIVDWLVRAIAPRWLRAAGLADHASALSGLSALGSPDALAQASPVIQTAAEAARAVHEQAWHDLASYVYPRRGDPAGWQALVDGAQTAAGSVRLVLDPAAQAVGYPPDAGRGPVAWSAAVESITDAADALSWSAAANVTRWAVWSPHLPPETVRALTYAAARSALGPVEAATQAAAGELLTVGPTGGEGSQHQ